MFLGKSTAERLHAWLFGAIAPIYEKVWKPVVLGWVSGGTFEDEVRGIFALYRPGGRERVLDVACGPGTFTTRFAQTMEGGFVVGMDIVLPMLKEGERRLEGHTLKKIAFVQADAHSLPFRSEAFDMVNCCGALHILADPAAALREMCRVLRPEGVLTGMTFAESPKVGVRTLGVILGGILGVTFFPLKRFVSLLEGAGFRCEGMSQSRLMVLFRAARS